MAPQERWQMTGSGPEAYERHLVPAIFAPWATLLLELARLQPGERVLDAACGTGVVARAARSRVGAAGTVTGVDLNPGMLEVARAVAGEAGQSIAWREGNLEALPFADGAFDVVLCQQGLQFCPDKAAAVFELRRVLRAGGRLVLSVWRDIRHFPYILAVTAALADHVSAEASQRMSAPCSFGDADALRAVLKQGGFKDVQVRIDVLPMRVASLDPFLPGQFVASPIAADIGALHERARAAFFADIERRLLPYMDDAGLAVPFEAHSVIALRGR
jgi:ubiquinone/menaquinone biosynthesis C-methylase UbiE